MIQWSPDTSPDAVQAGGGYAYADDRINGFSLTHLSGTGCPSYQDVPILPTEGALGSHPGGHRWTPSRTPTNRPAPGRYQVTLGPGPIDATLAVTHADWHRPLRPSRRGPASNVLFKVADSANPVSTASVHVVGDDEVEGQAPAGASARPGRTTRCTSSPGSTARSRPPGRGRRRPHAGAHQVHRARRAAPS